jgi:hypothetical protein
MGEVDRRIGKNVLIVLVTGFYAKGVANRV